MIPIPYILHNAEMSSIKLKICPAALFLRIPGQASLYCSYCGSGVYPQGIIHVTFYLFFSTIRPHCPPITGHCGTSNAQYYMQPIRILINAHPKHAQCYNKHKCGQSTAQNPLSEWFHSIPPSIEIQFCRWSYL